MIWWVVASFGVGVAIGATAMLAWVLECLPPNDIDHTKHRSRRRG